MYIQILQNLTNKYKKKMVDIKNNNNDNKQILNDNKQIFNNNFKKDKEDLLTNYIKHYEKYLFNQISEYSNDNDNKDVVLNIIKEGLIQDKKDLFKETKKRIKDENTRGKQMKTL